MDGKYPLQPLLDNVLKMLKHHLAPTVCRFAAVKELLACKQTKGMSVVDHTFNFESLFKRIYDAIALELKQSGDLAAPWLLVSQILPIRVEQLEEMTRTRVREIFEAYTSASNSADYAQAGGMSGGARPIPANSFPSRAPTEMKDAAEDNEAVESAVDIDALLNDREALKAVFPCGVSRPRPEWKRVPVTVENA